MLWRLVYRHREQARSHMGLHFNCGSELARDGVGRISEFTASCRKRGSLSI
ncbi:hypothetical protein EMIT043CA1_150123 [Pseudomonas brassicacearum]